MNFDENDEKLTMKRIVDHMKRNHVAYAKLNVRTSPESIESVGFINFTYQPSLYQTHIYVQIRNIIATEKNYERFVDSGRGVAIAIGNEDLSSIRIVKEPSDLEYFDSTKVKICVLSISSRGQKGRAPKCIKGHEMRFILPQTPSSYRNAGAWRCDDCLRVFNDPERPDFVLMRQPRFVCTKCSSSRCTDCAEARQLEDDDDEEEEEKSSTTNDLDEMQCHFCKKRGDGLQGEGRLFRACTLKRKPIYLHEFCCLFAPEVYVDAETKKLVKVNRVVDSAQYDV